MTVRGWEVLIIPAIAVIVWILATIFRGGNNAQQAPPRRRPDQFDDQPQRRPMMRVARPPDELRRGETPARRFTPPRPESKRPPVLLEEVKEPAPQTSLESTRAGYAPTQSPSKPPIEKSFPAPATPMLAQPLTPQTSLQSTRADYAPTQSPSQLPVATAAKPSASATLLQVRQLLRSPQSAAAALVLREILDAPRCRRRHT
jgi:hypothetical protein